jgi:D-alanine-D-alanine ligase
LSGQKKEPLVAVLFFYFGGMNPSGELSKIKIGVLMGGKSNERDISFKSGKNVMDACVRLGLRAQAFDAADPLEEALIREEIGLAFIALHGRFGEDGSIQGMLEYLRIPYTGSGVLASALAMDKVVAKRIFMTTGIPSPDFLAFERRGDLDQVADMIKKKFRFPVYLKPNDDGSSIGVFRVNQEKELVPTLDKLFNTYHKIFAEKAVEGRELTVALLGWGSTLRALPVLQLKPRGEWYDFKAKYTPQGTEFIVPAPLAPEITRNVQDIALQAHKVLHCHGFSRVDFVLDGDNKPWVLEVNTIPGLTNLSDMPAEAKAAGITFDEMVAEMAASAMHRPA